MGRLTGKNRAKARRKEHLQSKKRYSSYKNSFVDNIRKFDDPILKEKGEWCSNYDVDMIKKVAANLGRTLTFCSNGVGLSATQIGEPLALIAMRPTISDKIKILVDPKITYYSEEKLKQVEGCLSYPGYYPLVDRSVQIKVSYRDLEGKEYVDEEYKDFEARIIQHEVDHINLDGFTCAVGRFYELAKTDPGIVERNEIEARDLLKSSHLEHKHTDSCNCKEGSCNSDSCLCKK